jgi:hypothetical protein
MAIRFKHGGVQFTADTAEEAAQVMALLKQQDAQEAERRAWNRATIMQGGPGALRAYIAEEFQTPWTPEVFLNFVGRLGAQQKKALSLLVAHKQVSDEDLRVALNVPGNQALAGVLSGISKQAAALNIPARTIFSFENLRTGGKRRSTYSVSDKFLQIAVDMSWPSVWRQLLFPVDDNHNSR